MDRKALIQKRKSIPDRSEKEKAIVEKLLPFLKGKRCAGYVAVRGEASIMNEHISYVPKVIGETEMVFMKAENLQPGTFGVPEPCGTEAIDPQQIDVIVVPMVAFMKTWRIGYGNGYYDRYLRSFDGLKIGIAFDEQEVADYLPHEHDIPMDRIITPTRIIE